MKIYRYLFLVLIAVLYAYGNDSTAIVEDDPFSSASFDSVVTSVKASADPLQITYRGGLSFAAEVTGTYLVESEKTATDSRFYGKPFLKITREDIGSLFVSASFNYFLFASTNSELLRKYYLLQRADPSIIDLNLSEFHLSFDINKKIFIRLGNQLISWGASYFWSPEDFINRQKDQLTSLNAVDIRSGKPGARIHIPFERSNLFFFTDFSKVTTDGNIGSIVDNIAQACRLDVTLANVNIGTVGYVRANNPLYIGFDATGNILAADVYGECALSFNKKSDSTDPVLSAGFSKVFGQEKTWTFRSEVYYNSKGYGDTAFSSLRPGTFTPLYSGKVYYFTEMSTSKLGTSMIGSTVLFYMNCADRSFSSTLLFNLDFPKILPFTIYTRVNGGRLDREFTSSFGDRAITAGLRIRGDF